MNGINFLLKSGCKKLPVDLLKIISESGISLIPYSNFYTNKNIKQKILYYLSHDGFSIKKDGKYIIFYNDEIKNKKRIRWTLAHELIHIYSGHLEENFINFDPKLDKYVDYQTVKLLCPTIILKLCNIKTPKEIQKLCDVSLAVSQNAYQRLLSKKDYQFYNFTIEEQKLAYNFSKFIEQYNNYKFLKEIYF